MDSNRKPSGKGRGSFLLEMMKQKAQSEAMSHSVETSSVSATEQTSRSSEGYLSQSVASSSSSNGGRGRAQLVSLLKSMSSSSDSESRESPTIGHGRGSLSDLVKKLG